MTEEPQVNEGEYKKRVLEKPEHKAASSKLLFTTTTGRSLSIVYETRRDVGRVRMLALYSGPDTLFIDPEHKERFKQMLEYYLRAIDAAIATPPAIQENDAEAELNHSSPPFSQLNRLLNEAFSLLKAEPALKDSTPRVENACLRALEYKLSSYQQNLLNISAGELFEAFKRAKKLLKNSQPSLQAIEKRQRTFYEEIIPAALEAQKAYYAKQPPTEKIQDILSYNRFFNLWKLLKSLEKSGFEPKSEWLEQMEKEFKAVALIVIQYYQTWFRSLLQRSDYSFIPYFSRKFRDRTREFGFDIPPFE